jgi:hypothetical protein
MDGDDDGEGDFDDLLGEGSSKKDDGMSNLDNVQPDRIRQYPANYIGVYEVFIRQSKTPLKHLEISKSINEKFPGEIKSLIKMNSSKIRVEFKNLTSANALPKCDFLKDYRVYIPAVSVEISGLLSISTDTTVDEILSQAKGKFFGPNSANVKILDAYRFKRTEFFEDGKSREYNTPMVRVTFEGTVLPKWVEIHGLLIKVKLHTPRLMHCDNCLGHGHTSKYCNARSVCSKCGGAHISTSCESNPIICVHCKKNADHSFKVCPVYRVQFKRLQDKTAAVAQRNSSPLHDNPYSLLYEQPGPSAPTQSTSNGDDERQPRRKRFRAEAVQSPRSTPLPTQPRTPFSDAVSQTTFAQVIKNSLNENTPSGPKSRRRRRGRGRSTEHRERDEEDGPESREKEHDEPPGGNPHRKFLKDAIKSFIISKKWHPLLSSVLAMIVSPIVDWIWPMISPITPFLLSFLNQHGES